MTRHTTILAGRGARKRAVRVEHKRREATATQAARDPLRLLGTVMVADALGFADALGGVMTGERLKALAGRKGVRSGNGQNEPSTAEIPSPIKAPNHDPDLQKPGQIMPEIMPGLLAADVCRQIDFARGSFGRDLVETWL